MLQRDDGYAMQLETNNYSRCDGETNKFQEISVNSFDLCFEASRYICNSEFIYCH